MCGKDPARHDLQTADSASTTPKTTNRSTLDLSATTAVAGRQPIALKPGPTDVMAQCPKCKTMETVQVLGDVLTRCRRFSQRDGGIYHDCGSEEPCRLHRVSSGMIGETS